MKEYTVERADGPVALSGDPKQREWVAATRLRIERRPWAASTATAGAFPIGATAQLLYDECALYVQYRVTDGHQRASATELNGPVWKDSCVELFADPAPDDRASYLNFEANCAGQFLLGVGPGRADRRLASPALADAVRVETSVEGPRKEPDPATDEAWWLAVALPFDALEAFAGEPFDRPPGASWRVNLQCCREGAAPSYAMWSPVDAPDPDFHRPAAFGRLAFG
jgi:hypothetical protein